MSNILSKTTPKVRFFCFHCYEPVSAAAKYIGKQGQCPRCGKLTVIPPTSTRGPNRAAQGGKSAAGETDGWVPAKTGGATAAAKGSSGAVGGSGHGGAAESARASTNGAPAPGPSVPQPVIAREKIEVWKEVFRGKAATGNGGAAAEKAKG